MTPCFVDLAGSNPEEATLETGDSRAIRERLETRGRAGARTTTSPVEKASSSRWRCDGASSGGSGSVGGWA